MPKPFHPSAELLYPRLLQFVTDGRVKPIQWLRSGRERHPVRDGFQIQEQLRSAIPISGTWLLHSAATHV